MSRIIGVDPGSKTTGIVVIDGGLIVSAFNVSYDQFYDKVRQFSLNTDCTFVIEDIRPFTDRLTMNVIDTCKLIGEMLYRLKNEHQQPVTLLSRFDVKKWVFDCGGVAHLVDAKINKKLFDCCILETREQSRCNDVGKSARKGSFVYVDDAIVQAAMMKWWDISLPKPGSGYAYGLKAHSWQALGVATAWMNKKTPQQE
jgi:hypothetical protein